MNILIHRLCTTFWLSDSRCSIDVAIQEFLQDPSPCERTISGRHLWGSAIASAGEALVSETPLWPKMLPLAGAGFDFCYFSATCQWYFSGGRSFFSFWGFWREIGWKCDMETFFFRFWPVQSFRSSIAYTVADPSFGWGLKPPRLGPNCRRCIHCWQQVHSRIQQKEDTESKQHRNVSLLWHRLKPAEIRVPKVFAC